MAWPNSDPENFGQLQFQGHYADGQIWRNTYGFWGHDASDGLPSSVLDAFLASAYMDGLITAYKGLIAATDTLDGVLARQMFDPQNPDESKNESFRSVAAAGTHAAPGNLAPSELTPLLKIGTDQAGRSAHGRVFLPWWRDTGSITGENFTGGLTAPIDAVRTELAKLFYTAAGGHAGGGAADIDLVVISFTRRKDNQTPFAARVTSTLRTTRTHWLRSRGPRS